VSVIAITAALSVARAEDEKSSSVDPTGTYTWERTRGDRVFKSTLRLDLRGGKLTGSYKGRGDAVKIESAKVDGNKVSFQYTRKFNDREFTIKYQGTVTAAGIEGTVEFPSRDDGTNSRPWKAERIVAIADILGMWKFKVDGPNGDTLETSIIITNDGDKLAGQYKSRQGERQAKNLTLKDGELSFELSADTDNGSFSVIYKGKPIGNSIKGTLAYKFGDNEGTTDFVGQREPKGVRIADIVGTWKLEVTRENGESSESTITITADGEKLQGRYESPYGEREAKKLQVKGDELSFELSGDTDNGSFLVTYKGKLSGDSFKGTMSFEFGERKGTRKVIGRRQATKKPEATKEPEAEKKESKPKVD
jgi:hypothetical protein